MKAKTKMNTMKKVSAVLGMVMAMNTIAATGLVVSADDGGTAGRTAIVEVVPSGTSGSSSGGSGSNDDFSDWDQPTDREIDEAKQKAEKEQEKKEAKEEAAREKRQDIINQGGAMAGDYVAKLITGKFANSDEAKKAALNTAGKIFKDCVLKNIPYAGGAVSAIFGGVLGIGDADPNESINKRIDETNKKLDITNEQLAQANRNLQAINSSIIRTGTMINKTMTNATIENGYIASMNASANTMARLYSDYNGQVASAMVNIYNNNGEVNKADDEAISYIFSYGNGNARDTSANGYNLEYYNAFMNFDKNLKNGQFISGFDSFGAGKNIFEINDMTTNPNSYFTVDERETYLNNVSQFYSTGYEVLRSAMLYEREKLALNNCVASSQLVELKDMKENTLGDTSEIDAEIEKYNIEVSRTNNGLTDLDNKLLELDTAYKAYTTMADNQQTKIDSLKQHLIDVYNRDMTNPVYITHTYPDGTITRLPLIMPKENQELAEKWIQQQAQKYAKNVQKVDASEMPEYVW